MKVFKLDVVLERKKDGYFEKNRKSNDLSDVWCESVRSKNLQGVDEEPSNKMAQSSSMRCVVMF